MKKAHWTCLTPGSTGYPAREVVMAGWNEDGDLVLSLGSEDDEGLHPDRAGHFTLTRDELANIPPPAEVAERTGR